MYRIKTIKEIEFVSYDLKKIPKEVFDNLGGEVDCCGLGVYMLGQYIIDSMLVTNIPLPKPYPGTIRVINAMEWEQKHKHVKPASDLKPWLGIELHYNAHLRFDSFGNFWFWETATKTPNYISSQFIKKTIPVNHTISYKRAGDSMHVDVSFISDSAKQKDFFKLETETEYKINLNSNSCYIAKRDVAGYKKGDILSCKLFDQLTGDPIVIDLNTGKETRLGYDDYEPRYNSEYLKMKQDN